MSQDLVFSTLWADAVTEYEKQTKRNISEDHVFREFQTLDDLQGAVEESRGSFDTFRSGHRRLFSGLAKVISPMQPVLDIIQTAIGSTPYAPAAIVLGGASHLLKSCGSVTKAYDGIEELFERVYDITVRLKSYEHRDIESSLRMKITDILAYILEIIGKAEALVKRGRVKEWVRNVFSKNPGIESSIDKLRRYVEGELGLVIALTYATVKDTRNDLKAIAAGVDKVLASQRGDRQKLFSEADEKTLLDALKTKVSDDVAREHAANLEKLTEGTARWIRDDTMFQAWEQEQAPILWVFGKPGMGKSMIAARTIEMLQNRYPQHSDIPSLTSVSYLYFKDDDPSLQDCAQMLKAAALQLTKADDRFKKHVLALIRKRQQDAFASARQIWRQLFLDFFSEDQTSESQTSLAFLVVDGLDEGPAAERVKFLSCLAELVDRGSNGHECRLQVAVFARPSVRADAGFEKVGFRTQERIIEVTPDKNTHDIQAFIRERLGDVSVLGILRRRKPNQEYQALARLIYNNVQSRSQGMFLWARLVFDQIREAPSPEAIRDSLQGAPEGLDKLLHHVFKRLEAEEQLQASYLTDLLTWVLCAYRPLYMSELFVLLLISKGQHYYIMENHLKARYSSLFDVIGPPTDIEYDEEELGADANDNQSEQDDFDFLDEPDSGDTERETTQGRAPSDDENSEVNKPAEGTIQSGLGVQDDVFDIPTRWYQTTVTFSHARIRDYLTTECNPSTRRWHDCSIIPQNLNAVRLSVVFTCLRILLSDENDHYFVYSLGTYAKLNWIKHLVDIDFDTIPSSDAVQLVRRLSIIFRDGEALLEASVDITNDFIATWFCTEKYTKFVRDIVREQLPHLDEDEKDWALSITQSARTLFMPFIAACAKRWLTKKGWDDAAYLNKSECEVSMMYAFSLLSEEGTTTDSTDIFNVDWEMWTIPLDAIETIADLEPCTKNEHYYAGKAWIMMEAQEDEYTERATEYFQKALELKPGGWMAMEGLARCYGDNLCKYETAIHWMENALDNLPQTEDFEGIEFYLQTRISNWQLQLGQNQESVATAKNAYHKSCDFLYGDGTASDGATLRVVGHFMEALYRTERYPEVIDLLIELDRTPTLIEGNSLWTVFLRAQYEPYFNVSIFDKIGKITRVEKNDALQDLMRISIKNTFKLDFESIAEDQPTWLATKAAEWQYHYAPRSEESIELWEEIVRLVDQSNEVVQQCQAWYRTRAAKFLSMMFFDAAIVYHKAGEDVAVHIQKLETLASHRQGNKKYYRASYPALILGLWLHEHGKAKEDVWRSCIRPSIKQAIYLLSDQDPWNDQDAYSQLGKALLAADDILNASIALGITMKPIEDRRAMQQQSNDTQGSQQPSPSEVEEATTTQTVEEIPSADLVKEEADPQIEYLGIVGPAGTGLLIASDQREVHAKSPIESQEVSSHEEKDGDGADESLNTKYAGFECMWTCDGPCESSDGCYTELYFCRICDDVCFCENCIKLVRNDQMPYRCCASNHPHVQVLPMIEEAKALTSALIERRFEVQQEWLDGLKRVWNVDG